MTTNLQTLKPQEKAGLKKQLAELLKVEARRIDFKALIDGSTGYAVTFGLMGSDAAAIDFGIHVAVVEHEAGERLIKYEGSL